MTIELVKKGNKFLVRYKHRWLWRYVGHDHNWFWPTYGSEMDEDEARATIENMVENEQNEKAGEEVIETIEV